MSRWTAVREALPRTKLENVYDRVARRYDLQHRLVTFGSDERGRRGAVRRAVRDGDRVIDAGSGTGASALMAARRAGRSGDVTLYDLSEGMLAEARRKAHSQKPPARLRFVRGDMTRLPFDDATFDAALSTYSLCPLYDPVEAAREVYRVVRPGGRIGVAHSTEPQGALSGWLAEMAERLYWKMPELSLGCRAVNVLPALERAGGTVTFRETIGFPLWPFLLFVVEKPEEDARPAHAAAGGPKR